MVSTRGGARTSGPDDASTMLRKKPVRKATAKAPATTTAVKAKTTRSKKTEPEPEIVDDDEPDELQEDALAPTKTTRKVTTRAKKSEEPAKPTTTKGVASRAPAKTAKAATRATRTKAAEEIVEENVEKKPETKKPELKPATQSRATRATRATAAKEKAAPLSPKKITQVSKAPARSTKASGAKSSATTVKSAAAKPAMRGRPAGRRRNVSDENADIPELAAPAEAEESDVEVAPKKQSATRGKNAAKRAASPMVIDDDTPISTRPATPAESLQQETHDKHDDAMQTTQQPSEDEDDDVSEQSSQDELSGPKSPMKRLSPREAVKYASAKKSALPDIDVPMKTPVRRFAVLGTQQGTPQTSKPYCKPAVPLSDGKPMTVARAQSRAMVFPRLQPLPQAADDSMDVDESPDTTTVSDQSTPIPQRIEAESSEAQDDASEPRHDMDPDLSLLVDPENRTTDIESTDDMLGEAIETQAEAIQDKSSIEASEEQPPQAAEEEEEHIFHIEEDPDETIVTLEGAENDASPAQDHSFDSFESVIVTRPELQIDEDEKDADSSLQDDRAPLLTPGPETLVWENIRDDVTIPFNFDANVSPSRDPVGSESPSLAREDHAVSDALQDDSSTSLESADAQEPQRESTVRLSEFVDIASLAGSLRSLAAEIQADSEDSAAAQATVEDEEESQSVIDGDVTMVCAEPPTPRTVKRSPVRLTTVEQVDEDEMLVDGDVTLMLDRRESPASATRSPVKLTTVEHVDDEEDVAVDGEMSLLLEQPDHGPSVALSPIKLSTAEDYPEEEEAVAGDETLILEDHFPPPPEIPATPVLVNDARASDVTSIDLQDPSTPHYALPTFASRRKSISSAQQDMEQAEAQSQTSNAAESPLGEAWFDKMQRSARRSLSRSRPGTPVRSRSVSRGPSAARRTPISRTPESNTFGSRQAAVKERMPGLRSAATYEELLEKPAGNSHVLGSPIENGLAVNDRYPGLPARQTYEVVDNSFDARATPRKTSTMNSPARRTPVTRSRTPQQQTPKAVPASTPQPAERFPGLPAKRSYDEHAKTAMPATRFATPERRSTRRPATAQKATSLRKLALTSNVSRTPIKSPLKAPAETPAQVPMTPHPKAPLKGVVALVDVYTSDGGCATGPFSQLLQRLGAKTTKTFSDRVTHVVFKDGHPKLLQTLVIHNKQIAENGSAKEVFCVNSRWVNDCDANGVRMAETDEAYAVDIDDAPRVAKRRRKSMEPMSLLNNGGNIVRDRKSSIGRVSIGRLSSKTFDMPLDEDHMTPKSDAADKENSEDSEAGSSPATPAYLSAPEKLVQQTAPMNRIRKLDLSAKDQARRLTFTNMEF